jgi:hypothetical protein
MVVVALSGIITKEEEIKTFFPNQVEWKQECFDRSAGILSVLIGLIIFLLTKIT